MSRRDLAALGALSSSLIRRLLREGLVMRSLVWPTALAGGTLLGTLVVVALLRVSAQVAVTPEVSPQLRQAFSTHGWAVVETPAPEALVLQGEAWAGTDGRAIWLRSPSTEGLVLEALVREERGASWSPAAQAPLPRAAETAALGTQMVQILMLLFALYGVVFGLGMVARDRDDGTLEAELSLPIRRWVPGAARWIAGTAVLTVFLAYSVAFFHALVGVTDPGALLRHGFAAAGGSVTLGIAVIGRAGIKQGFSGPLAFGLTGATALLGFGAVSPAIGQWLPVCSLLAGGSGWSPAGLTLISGVLASALFAWRSAHA